jgi:hypothetical protein
MSGRHDTPFSDLLPDDLPLTLSGSAALAVASRDAANLVGVDERAALASARDDTGVLVALINDGNEDKRPGAFT